MAKGKHRTSVAKKRPQPGSTLSSLIGGHPKLLAVLDRHGVTFCAGCYLTLTSSLERVAAYHAVPDRRRFLKDVRKALSR